MWPGSLKCRSVSTCDQALYCIWCLQYCVTCCIAFGVLCGESFQPQFCLYLQDRPVIIARTQFIREHRLYEVVSRILLSGFDILAKALHHLKHLCTGGLLHKKVALCKLF